MLLGAALFARAMHPACLLALLPYRDTAHSRLSSRRLIAIPRNQNQKVAVLLQPRHARLASLDCLNSYPATVRLNAVGRSIFEGRNEKTRQQENHIAALGAGGSRPQVDRPRAWGKEYVAATSAVYLHPTDPHHADCLPALRRKCPRPLAFAAPGWAKGRNARLRVQGLRQPNEINRQRLSRRNSSSTCGCTPRAECVSEIIRVCLSPHAQSGGHVRLGS